MTADVQLPKALKKVLLKASTASGPQLVKLAQNPLVLKAVTGEVEKLMMTGLKDSRSDPGKLPGIEDDRTAMSLAIMGSIERALSEKRLSESYLRTILQILVKTLFMEGGDTAKVEQFRKEYGMRSPSFLLISPGKACNLHCTGCYADSTDQPKALEWSIVDRAVEEAKTLWGDRFFVISGGEPFAYRSEGKGIIDLIEKHSDCFFMAYTNATLINEEVSKRLAKAGNLLLCISVEGWRERTDERRGKGVYDKILETMSLLRRDGVPFGISLTGTRYNAEEILSEEFIDFFMQQGAIFGWLFQYMPIGRAYTLDLMVTPQQRTWMWHRSWDIVRQRRFFLADFWNHGTACDGCLSAGGHGAGGYFYIDWNGAVSPCVFLPYSPVNIRDVYARGGDLNDIWKDPFFRSLRQWQLDYKKQNRNGLAPCPSRDHHDELEKLLMEFEPEPIDINAAETLSDPDYTRGLVAYNQEFETLTHDIWENHYVHRADIQDTSIVPLPDLPDFKNTVERVKSEKQNEPVSMD
ncbi:MAG: radical SAM protein [Chloroflexi bacterium]|nr:radical SAM protein [Chloroflexota bacterium]